jgi:hypothetical protein
MTELAAEQRCDLAAAERRPVNSRGWGAAQPPDKLDNHVLSRVVATRYSTIYHAATPIHTDCGAFTVSYGDRDNLIEYIKGQAEHHRRELYLDKYRRLPNLHGIAFDERAI